MNETADRRIGQTIQGRYRLEALLGVGGFGAVYKARHLSMGTVVALKILHREHCHEATAVKRFELEATRTASLVHPNSIKVFDFGPTDGGEFFIAMEYLEGRSLTSLIRREGHIAPDRVVHILSQVLRALDEAHLKGIVHRDMKPDNIFLLEIGHERDFVKVLDYGIAKAKDPAGSGLTAVGQVIGTPVYMAPEQCLGKELDGRSDLYAVGCIAYHMLTGRPPFVADDAISYAIQHVEEQALDVREVAGPDHPIPTGLAAWVHKLLAKAREERYASAHEALDALSSALSGPSTWDFTDTAPHGLVREVTPGSRRVTREQPRLEPSATGLAPALPRRKRWWAWTLGALGVFALGGGLALVIGRAREAPPEAPTIATSGARVLTTGWPSAAPALVVADVVDAPDAVLKDAAVAERDAASDATLAAVADALPEPGPDARPETTAAEVTPVVARVVHLTSTPAGATVVVAGRVIGTTPCDVRWSDKPPVVELRKASYLSVTLRLREDQAGQRRHVVLKKRFVPLDVPGGALAPMGETPVMLATRATDAAREEEAP